METIEERAATKCEVVSHIWIGGLAWELRGVETVNNVFLWFVKGVHKRIQKKSNMDL